MNQLMFNKYMMREMRKKSYLKKGATKGINIDFTLLWPGQIYIFVNVNMLLEFTAEGQVLPTRLDILPYTLSPFSNHSPNKDEFAVEMCRVVLIMQVFFSIICDMRKLTCKQVCSVGFVKTFGMDIVLIGL